MILCGERINAATAERIGLVEEVVAKGEALDKALALAEQVGQQSPTSVAFCKRLVHTGRNTVIGAGLEAERDLFVDLFSTQDQREGVNAFLEKRKPEWKNG
jgi:enoyl-CoA hydratase/carnithine racemase